MSGVPCPGGTPWTVRPGDTLFLIARRFGVALDAVVAANPGIDPYNLRVGSVVCVPSGPPAQRPTPPGAPPPGAPPRRELPVCPSGIFWEVGPGDTFFLIARRFGISADELMAANPTQDPANLQVGTILCVPRRAPGAPAPPPGPPRPLPPCASGIFWEVAPGETMFTIARRTGISLDALLRANPHVDPNRMQVGTVLCLPSGN